MEAKSMNTECLLQRIAIEPQVKRQQTVVEGSVATFTDWKITPLTTYSV